MLLLGIWLALEVDSYELWDGWIIAAIVLWLIASAAGGRLSREVAKPCPARRGCCSPSWRWPASRC